MKSRSVRSLSVLACFLWISACADNQAASTDDVNVLQLHPKAIVVGSGDSYDDSVIAVASEGGLVMIDTGISPTLTRGYRAKIEETFGRSDFAYVVNTHYHFDHTNGNQVFPEATVVTRELMIEWNETRAEFVARQRTRVDGWRETLTTLEPDSEQAPQLRDLVRSYGQMCDDLEGDFALAPPTITFSDRLSLDFGDLTLRMYAYGPGTHTGDDILVHIPELGILATGDLFFAGSVQFVFQIDTDVDIAHKIAVLDAIIADGTLEHAVTVHNGIMSAEDFVARRDYMSAVWKEANTVAEEGGSLADVSERLGAVTDMPFLADLGIPADALAAQHDAGVAMTWLSVQGGEDAAELIIRALDDGGTPAAWREFHRILPLKDEKYLVDEGAFNRLGYRLLGEDRLDEAIAVFEMNVEAYPDAWNVYDSLGEAMATRGDIDLAISNYRRSLELNPDNSNATIWIERLLSEG
jgi:glyoxylase-like metal-dependent hydrolase (beta-lactamase superfamily II)